MALLELGGRRFPIPAGELIVGSDGTSAIALTGPGVLPKHAVLHAQPDGQVVIRKATPTADVLINGVRLGAEPTPLLHGDKVGIGGHELSFVDEQRSGSTQFVQAFKPQDAALGVAKKGAIPGVANTGGRIVSLTDGREYVITGSALVFGRDAGSDVVVGGKDVSRRHAEIVPTTEGYMLVDSSTNGTFVNEERVRDRRLLARAEVVRIGEERFRFYADLVAAPAVTPAPPPGPPPPAVGGSLANFFVKGGALKGQRFQIRTPVANIGRADYNDVVLADPSVSTSHAKLQRREGVWVLVDLDSTNGTFVDDERVKGEMPIAPGATVRIGDIPLTFDPTDDALGMAKGGGTVVFSRFAEPLPAPPPAPAPPLKAPSPRPAPSPSPARAAPRAAPARPQPKRPQSSAPAPAKKKGKGCGTALIVIPLGGAGLVAALRWIVA